MNFSLWCLTASSIGLATIGASMHRTNLTATSDVRPVGEIAELLEAPEYQILPDRGLDLFEGVLVGVDDLQGDLFVTGHRLTRGVYHNFTDQPVTVAFGSTHYVIEPGGVLGVGRE